MNLIPRHQTPAPRAQHIQQSEFYVNQISTPNRLPDPEALKIKLFKKIDFILEEMSFARYSKNPDIIDNSLILDKVDANLLKIQKLIDSHTQLRNLARRAEDPGTASKNSQMSKF